MVGFIFLLLVLKRGICVRSLLEKKNSRCGGGFMQVIELNGKNIEISNLSKPTNKELQNEYNYIFAEELTRKLFVEGFITEEECEKIMRKNRLKFKPFLSKILP
ncbi:TPA: hypothetical protein TVN94_000051 [Streptococcus equi subsp. zooepidemicus]|uniref:SHOCT domain-containing protein n=1 Tax=Streptococcus equi TaxID=1336 RepID=UPI00197D5992|nr:SHOCT domain-containing protein [Streptococcus equi]MCD3406885.1 hypothetical protein [Streptococcus equi subsp. zooepidemicus]MDI5946329.1 hypothetical protein [Streptococcus equi subsp. zooepidemicus]MDI5957414.1 hypothetical protein [Streptococcus equi subsp. zooepidemicus]MDI6087957.1 hypothetical protein [Streptococcus equi subsp. zooepidemicus]HEK9985612.1 hypothetical protein [Streptococcus equi subsp. zooepidemicus]